MLQNEIIDVKETGLRMREVRVKHSMTVEKLSIVMNGVSTELIIKIENGEFVPTLEYVFDFCNLFEVSIDEIVISNL